MRCKTKADMRGSMDHFSKISGRNGFTLVELLVVIGIIALLISILLPSMANARKQAKLVQCQSNLRSLGQGIGIYTAQNRQTFPNGINYDWEYAAPTRYTDYSYPRNAAGHPNWFPTADKLNYPWSSPYKAPVYIQEFVENLFPPVRNANATTGSFVNPIWTCPEVVPGSAGQPWMTEPNNTHYRYNLYYAAGRRTSMMKSSSLAMIMYDCAWPDWVPGQYPHYPPKFDKAGVNVLYGDGHTGLVSLKELSTRLDWRQGIAEGDTAFYKTGWRLTNN